MNWLKKIFKKKEKYPEELKVTYDIELEKGALKEIVRDENGNLLLVDAEPHYKWVERNE